MEQSRQQFELLIARLNNAAKVEVAEVAAGASIARQQIAAANSASSGSPGLLPVAAAVTTLTTPMIGTISRQLSSAIVRTGPLSCGRASARTADAGDRSFLASIGAIAFFSAPRALRIP